MGERISKFTENMKIWRERRRHISAFNVDFGLPDFERLRSKRVLLIGDSSQAVDLYFKKHGVDSTTLEDGSLAINKSKFDTVFAHNTAGNLSPEEYAGSEWGNVLKQIGLIVKPGGVLRFNSSYVTEETMSATENITRATTELVGTNRVENISVQALTRPISQGLISDDSHEQVPCGFSVNVQFKKPDALDEQLNRLGDRARETVHYYSKLLQKQP